VFERPLPYFEEVFLLKGDFMILQENYIYIIKDEFFEKVDDINLKGNKEENRPHYYLFDDDENLELFWIIPLSIKVEKYENMISEFEEKNKKRCDKAYIIKINNKKSAVLIQDIFPITKKYIDRHYTINENPLIIKNTKDILEIKKRAITIMSLIKRGIKFNPTQPDVLKIKNILIKEICKDKKPSD
jgi:hypothetical protein